ncbi:uncharacterized protein LOC117612609 [Prunus dulcis]|uniref:uncharacterized protein LOC117612609 n=1 Tax=Prunus dulcis TaxID=3755 RepID=UPI001482B27E|nr:uncharacterized protein LOC117612609 [Prunus dulcis]
MQGDPNFQQTLELLTQALARTGQPRDPSLGYADQAKRIGATDFDGDGNPAVAEEWIERMERIMEVMVVPQNCRVTLATFFWIRNTRHWWDSVKMRYRDPLAITWQVFRAAFDSQYYLQAYQNVKMQEFLQLEQGIMIVLEYEQRFNDLSKYCLPLVEDEIKKCQLFTMGLKASIRDIVISQRLTNFGDVAVLVRDHPREAVTVLDHLVATATEDTDLALVPVEVPTRMAVLETAPGEVQLEVLGDSCCQHLAGGVAANVPSVNRETTAASTLGTGMQGRSEEIPQFVEASSSGGAQTSVASRGSSQQRGRGGRSRATGRVYNMSQQEAHASPDEITAMTAKRLLRKGCSGYIAHVIDTRDNRLRLEDIPVVQEFPDVFPEHLPGLPPHREIEFIIELAPGTNPISQALYRMVFLLGVL